MIIHIHFIFYESLIILNISIFLSNISEGMLATVLVGKTNLNFVKKCFSHG